MLASEPRLRRHSRPGSRLGGNISEKQVKQGLECCNMLIIKCNAHLYNHYMPTWDILQWYHQVSALNTLCIHLNEPDVLANFREAQPATWVGAHQASNSAEQTVINQQSFELGNTRVLLHRKHTKHPARGLTIMQIKESQRIEPSQNPC